MIINSNEFLLGKNFGKVCYQTFEFVVFLTDLVVKVHGFTLALDAALLSTHLVPESLSLFDREPIFLCSFELLFEPLDSLLCLDKVHIVSFPLPASPLRSKISLIHSLFIRFELHFVVCKCHFSLLELLGGSLVEGDVAYLGLVIQLLPLLRDLLALCNLLILDNQVLIHKNRGLTDQ